ncbi:Heat shock protein [Sparassis crispa]|uniref:Heat shock protein n=1 Tax=Sparassis crispa TaxID=139825 RepID=A0A401GYC4_9APHY|nr:Heat shock protein [Sparassis crispa]GBE87216.1 Heat shock protein [Sparassis crispa]
MSLSTVFYEPFYSLADFNRLFDEAFTRTSGDTSRQMQRPQSGPKVLRPRMDVHEDAKNNTVTATFELPGLTKENVSIDVHNGVLTISGEAKISGEHEEAGYAVRERRYGRFSRALPVPEGIKSEEIRASMENGVLTVKFPKTTPVSASQKIAIA